MEQQKKILLGQFPFYRLVAKQMHTSMQKRTSYLMSLNSHKLDVLSINFEQSNGKREVLRVDYQYYKCNATREQSLMIRELFCLNKRTCNGDSD
ncbi:hypothetical protein KIN20_013918 [Parelaphostrongylus tenuis]|uniref:Uncharacterized protein n=1 Tax=Parelaphostrongylus tenuis TaxID=148309 RepID=A0AAD5MGA8_PARTN|nr:hypothetical protein KIN20_013918 [Parelaphostrongylus tenuis]